jgi:iron complex transport system substrate-binding protein
MNAGTWIYLLLLFISVGCAVKEVPPVSTESGGKNLADTLFPRYANYFRVLEYRDSVIVEVLDADGEVISGMRTLEDRNDIRLACMSTTHASILAALGLTDRIAGMAFSDRILDTTLLHAAERGSITDIGEGGSESIELLLQLKPDIYFIYPYEIDASQFSNAGLRVFALNEYLEESPLGRAEWLVALGTLCGRKHQADSLFRIIEQEYREVKSVLSGKEAKPEVFVGTNYEEHWYASGGKGLLATVIKDAGGRYSFETNPINYNLTLDFETMIAEASDADFWGDIRFGDTSSAELSGMVARMKGFKAFTSNNLFYCDASKWDYFGRGVIEPQVILKDLANIFHPGSFPDHKQVYFRLETQ